jgi:hypothetical protein
MVLSVLDCKCLYLSLDRANDILVYYYKFFTRSLFLMASWSDVVPISRQVKVLAWVTLKTLQKWALVIPLTFIIHIKEQISEKKLKILDSVRHILRKYSKIALATCFELNMIMNRSRSKTVDLIFHFLHYEFRIQCYFFPRRAVTYFVWVNLPTGNVTVLNTATTNSWCTKSTLFSGSLGSLGRLWQNNLRAMGHNPWDLKVNELKKTIHLWAFCSLLLPRATQLINNDA